MSFVAAGLAVQEIFEKEDIFKRAKESLSTNEKRGNSFS